jgi:hypothetical protein
VNRPEQGAGKEVIKVRLLRAGKVIRSYKIRSDTFTIGSGEGCTIRAAGDKSLKPIHATMYIEDGDLTLVPESGALVFLNGEAVDFALPGPDDVLKAGRLTFNAEVAASMKSTIPPPPAYTGPGIGTPIKDREDATEKRVDPRPPASKQPRKPATEDPALKQTILGFDAADLPADDPIEWRGGSLPHSGAPKKIVPDFLNEIPDFIPMEDDSVALGQTMLDASAEQPLVAPAVATAPDEADFYFFNDDDLGDEFTFSEPFDLVEALREKRPTPGQGPVEPYCAAHVVRSRGGRVLEAFGVLPGKAYVSRDGEIQCRIKGGRLRIKAQKGLSGDIQQGNSKTALQDVSPKGKRHVAVLREGDSAQLTGARDQYQIDVYRPPRAPRSGALRTNRGFIILFLLAGILHLVVGGAVAYMQPAPEQEKKKEPGKVFAEVKMDKPEPPKLKEVKPRKVKDTLSMSEKAPAVSNRTIRKVSRQKITRSSSVTSLLKVLSKGSGKPGKSDRVKDLVSNVDAVAAPGGAKSSFSIAGAIASLPGQGVNIARQGGGGDVSTLSGDDVAGKGTGIGTLGKAKRKGRVRGRVTKMSSGAKVGGSLSKADVLRVINAHIHAIQACYERALMSKPGLSGRIAFDWSVNKAGKVTGVRVRSSTIGSPKVASCISKQIKRWKFPRPKGGAAKITFPFLFRSGS